MALSAGIVGQAVGLFAITNVDDILVLSLFFARGAGQPGVTRRVTLGQYLAFVSILAVSIASGFGASFLPESALPYLGLLPLGLGLWSAWTSWRHRGEADGGSERTRQGGPRTLEVAAVTLANGGDNVGVYAPVFATAGAAGISVYSAVFLILVAVWCLAGKLLSGHPAIGKALSRWGHILHPAVLTGIGLFILIDGGAFGL